MIDLLWAEAARLEDLPPFELRIAAVAKKETGHLNRARLRNEAFRLNRYWTWHRTLLLTRYLRYSEWRQFPWTRGISEKRLNKLENDWNKRYLGA